MKKKLLLLAMCFTLVNFAQNSYGKHIYNHRNSECSSGLATQTAPGFLIGGYSPLSMAMTNNFYVDRTDKNGVFSGSPWEFQMNYSLLSSVNCTSTPQPINNCAGVSIVEMSNGTGYAVAGACNLGAFFVQLNNAGLPVATLMYNFPAVTATDVSQPLITESSVYPNEYYITGSYRGILYTLRVNSWGAVQAVHSTDQTTNFGLIPKGIVESPYGSNDVTIVGLKNNGADTDGFLYQIDNTLTTVTNARWYDLGTTSTNHSFHSLVTSNPGNPVPGFLIGGHTSVNTITSSWVLKVDPSGNIIWQSVVQGNLCPNSSTVTAVAERFSAFNNIFESYAAAHTPTGIVVYKLDNNGAAMSSSFGAMDEFLYNDGSQSSARPVAIGFHNNGAPWDEGLHIYGNLNSWPGEHYLVESYFSGEAGCNNPISTINAVYNYTSITGTFTDSPTSQITSCFSFSVTSKAVNNYTFACFPVPSIAPPATNNRVVHTEIADFQKNTAIDLYPNPSNGQFYLRLQINEWTRIEILDVLGNRIPFKESKISQNTLKIDMTNSNKTASVYLLKIMQPGMTEVRKLIYEP